MFLLASGDFPPPPGLCEAPPLAESAEAAEQKGRGAPELIVRFYGPSFAFPSFLIVAEKSLLPLQKKLDLRAIILCYTPAPGFGL